MIQNDLQRLRWQFLDEALRDPVLEFFMGERTSTNETGNTRSLIYHINKRLKEVNRNWSCSKRMLQNDVAFFKKKVPGLCLVSVVVTSVFLDMSI